MYRYCGTYSYTEVLVCTTELILILRNLIRYRSTRRYYRTYTETGLYRYRSTRRYYRTDQIRTDAGVPVGTTEQIRYRTKLIRYRSTRRYYRTDQMRNRTYSDTGVPVGTAEQIRCRTELIQIRNLSDT